MDWFGTPLRPLVGGYSGETFLVGDHGAEQVLRIYARNPDRCLVDAALLRLLESVIPVPRVIECRPADGDNPGVLVTERLPGVRLDLV
ncbi:MAG: phosphotransferase, partial [Actinomycetota bacterium]|nr:phosphotransferase [Actinomycetota bacterium]